MFIQCIEKLPQIVKLCFEILVSTHLVILKIHKLKTKIQLLTVLILMVITYSS